MDFNLATSHDNHTIDVGSIYTLLGCSVRACKFAPKNRKPKNPKHQKFNTEMRHLDPSFAFFGYGLAGGSPW